MLTNNISFSDRLISVSIATVKHLDMRSNLLCSTVYVAFDDAKAGNSLILSWRNVYQLLPKKEASCKERKKYYYRWEGTISVNTGSCS